MYICVYIVNIEMVFVKMYVTLLKLEPFFNLTIIVCLVILIHLNYNWDTAFQEIRLKTIEVKNAHYKQKEPVIIYKDIAKPKMVFNHRSLRYEQILGRVLAVIDLIGYQYERWDNSTPLDFDFLWCNHWPYEEIRRNNTARLKKHQIVNQIAGSGRVSSKNKFVQINSSGILPAFFLPKDEDKLVNFIQKHPKKLFVSKGFNHRKISLQDVTMLIEERKSKTFVQEFLGNPLLIDGYKFEIGVYAYITTLKPLRIYIYDDIQIRFCNKKYLPFNVSDKDSYIIKGTHYYPIWKVDSFKEIYKMGYSKKDCFNWYIEAIYGEKVLSHVWKSVNNIITDVYLEAQEGMFRRQNYYAPNPNSRNFNEHVRLDFLISEEINVFVMEANFAPNLDTTEVPENKNMFEQVIFNSLHIRGVTSRLKVNYIYDAIVADKDIFTSPNNCILCSSDCTDAGCRLCPYCLSYREKEVLKEAWIENSRKHMTKRVFPTSITIKNRNLMPIDQIQADWFLQKCADDSSWCE